MKLKLGAVAVLTAVASLSMASVAGATSTLLGGEGQRATTPARPAPAPAPKAGTAVTIGEVSPAPGGACGSPATTLQAATSGTAFTVPGAGVITSYSYYANAAPGSVQATLFTPGPAVGHWTLVGKSVASPVTVSAVNTFATRIPVPAGATLGVTISAAGMDCGRITGNASDVLNFQVGFDPNSQTDLTASALGSARTNMLAVWEPDVDGDGFGDVSQDLCSQSSATQAACPAPQTTVKKPRVLASGKVKIKFKSSIPGSTFTCKIDRKATKACKSPLVKRFSFGKHKIVVTAISPFGIPDPTPFKGKFRLVRR